MPRANNSSYLVFAKAVPRSIGAGLAILSTVATFVFLPRQRFWTIPIGVAFVVVFAAFRAVRIVRAETDAEISRLQDENARLKVKPYDSDRLHLVEEKLRDRSALEKDLLRFLTLRGESDGYSIHRACPSGGDYCAQALESLTKLGLINKHDDNSARPVQIISYWKVNPNFVDVLKDLLFPRPSSEGPPSFSF